MKRCAIIGYGFLGRALLKRLSSLGMDYLKIVGIANSKGFLYSGGGIDISNLPYRIEDANRFRDENPLELINKQLVDMIVELTPTNIETGEPGLTYIREALSQGIDVVTANKGPLVLAFNEIRELAERRGALLRYEATVGGGIPIFSLMRHCLRGERIVSMKGILNGTTNYVLTRMHFEGMSLELALNEARMLGIAERDPTLDIEGIDTASKIVILANSLMGLDKTLRDVEITGIRKVTPEVMMLAKESGMTIKLIGRVEGDELMVGPMLVRLNNPLCVHGTLNAISYRTSVLGNLTLIGEGAGESTVVSLINDIFDILESRRH